MRVRVKVNQRVVKNLRHHRDVKRGVGRTAHAMAGDARGLAPKDQGGGAASITAEEQPDGTWRVSWDKRHYYMQFPELGTLYQPPQPFLRPAAGRYQ